MRYVPILLQRSSWQCYQEASIFPDTNKTQLREIRALAKFDQGGDAFMPALSPRVICKEKDWCDCEAENVRDETLVCKAFEILFQTQKL